MGSVAPRWKEVSDELPPDDEVVLVATAEGHVRTASHTSAGAWVSGDGRETYDDVCFWQPLPEVPAAVAEVDPAHPPLFLVEEWEYEASEIAQVLLDEEEALQIWEKDQEAGRQNKRRSCGTRVHRWVFTRGKYELDPEWPPVGRRTT